MDFSAPQQLSSMYILLIIKMHRYSYQIQTNVIVAICHHNMLDASYKKRSQSYVFDVDV